ncbi:MAG: hypothetical protein OEM93_22740 [Rhodospirillales bacterium]|nr:hypothetical protein [Rhodospirillales bacterium]MDH3917594.1 hypothetical protein [Rhodospirillales bacterium]
MEQHSDAAVIGQSYDIWLVFLSYAVVVFASYTSFHLVERVIAASNPAARMKWLVIGAVAMGTGIWTMHFVAMLALEMGYGRTARYDLLITALSAVFAMAASGFAFNFVSRKSRGVGRLVLGGTVLGAGIGLMHYTGMAAMRMDTVIRYDPIWFGASIVVAVLLSCLALRLMSYTVEARENEKPDHRMMTALVMGLSVTLMHYTGMAATNFLLTGESNAGAPGGLALDDSKLALIIGVVALVVLGLSWLVANAEKKRAFNTRNLQSSEQGA